MSFEEQTGCPLTVRNAVAPVIRAAQIGKVLITHKTSALGGQETMEGVATHRVETDGVRIGETPRWPDAYRASVRFPRRIEGTTRRELFGCIPSP